MGGFSLCSEGDGHMYKRVKSDTPDLVVECSVCGERLSYDSCSVPHDLAIGQRIAIAIELAEMDHDGRCWA